MIRPLYWLGIALTGGALLAMAIDFAAHAKPVRAPVLPTPEGFRMNLKGVGPVEVAFTGQVELITDEREEEQGGGATRVPRWKVNGQDPLPDGAGMAIHDTRIEALARAREGEPPMIAVTPRAWIPLTRDRGLLTLDLERAWRLTDPVLDLPGFRPGTRMTARARGMTELEPDEEVVRSRGWFQLEAENLELRAAGFGYEAKTGRVSFEPWQGEVNWSFTDELGRTLRGRSDSGGTIVPRENGELLLRFDEGARGVRSEVPAGKDAPPATLLARSLDLIFAHGAKEDSWQLRTARARGPLLLSDARAAFEGGAAEFWWSPEDGSLQVARIAGPLAVHPWDPPMQAATARESAVYDAAAGTLALDGGAWAADARGFLAAKVLRWNGAELEAFDEVIAHGAQGTALAERAVVSESGGVHTSGEVRLHPWSGLVEELAGPSLSVTPELQAEMNEGFRARGLREGLPWTLSGQRLRRWLEPDRSSRVEAIGPLVWTEPGMRIEGDRFKQLGEREFRFEGTPARAWLALDSGEEAEASFRRADYGELALHLEGEPWLRIPAAALGLAGEPVELRARTARREHATGAWSLDGSVRAAGALSTEVDQATWSPTDGLKLTRAIVPPIVEGTLANGIQFWVTAREFGISAEREIRLAGSIHGRLTEPQGALHEFWAERAQASEYGGFAETHARVASPLGQGRGDRIEWRSADGEVTWLKATGRARLESEELTAEGARIEVDQLTGWVEAEGTPAEPAWAQLSDGREVRAVWLRYNSRSHLIESGPVRLATPEPLR